MKNYEVEIVVRKYCGNGMNLLKKICFPIIKKFGGLCDLDYDDFYSIANETVWQAAIMFQKDKENDHDYDQHVDVRLREFDVFLKICLLKKFKTEMTRKNRKKRIPVDKIYGLYDPISNDEGSSAYIDVLSSDFNMDDEVKGLKNEGLEMFLTSLSRKQFQIVELIIIGFEKDDIKRILGIDEKRYEICIGRLRNLDTRLLLTGKYE